MTIPKGVRKVGENILLDGRAIIVTEEDDTKVPWEDIPNGSLKINPVNGFMSVKLEGETTWIPCGLKNDGTICIAKDSKRNIEVFTIKNPDNGDGTFTYEIADGQKRTKSLSGDGFPIFELEKGSYIRKRNALSVKINDTLERTAESGGIDELTETSFKLNEKYGVGVEITAEYLVRFNLGNPYPRMFVSNDEPPTAEYGDFWLDTDAIIPD